MQQCTKCILDTTVEDISFDENGVCNYCREYDNVIKTIPHGEKAKKVLNQIVKKIKEDGKNKKILDKYVYDLGMCTFCNLCVVTCPSDAIQFSNNFENAVFDRNRLVQQLNNEGSKLRVKTKEN